MLCEREEDLDADFGLVAKQHVARVPEESREEVPLKLDVPVRAPVFWPFGRLTRWTRYPQVHLRPFNSPPPTSEGLSLHQSASECTLTGYLDHHVIQSCVVEYLVSIRVKVHSQSRETVPHSVSSWANASLQSAPADW